MKIAAIIQAHKRPDLVAALTQRLNTPLWRVYIHIDAKYELDIFSRVASGAIFLEERIRVYWGGFSQVEATILLLRRALSDSENTYFYLMSGQCYPIKSDNEIITTLSNPSIEGNFIEMVKLPVIHKPFSRLSQRRFNDVGNWRVRTIINKLFAILPQRSITNLFHGMEPWGGSAWWMLNRDAATRIITFIDNNAWYKHAFRYTHCPDEAFFQTIVNCLGIQVDAGCPTEARWKIGNSSPEIITPEIFSELSQGWHFCLRKFDKPGSSIVNKT